METNLDRIIHGKNATERIVAMEPVDSGMILFKQHEDGSIYQETVPHKYWILSYKKVDDKWVKLDGEQHYKYGRQFSDRRDFFYAKTQLRKHNIDFYSIGDFVEAFQVKDGYSSFRGMRFSEVSVLSFDIETTGLVMDDTSKILLIANTYRDSSGKIMRRLFDYSEYDSQKGLIDDWCSWVREIDPTIVCGHNVNVFDVPYIAHVAELSSAEMLLGRDGSGIVKNSYTSKFRKDGTQEINYNKYHIFGRHIVDTFFLAVKYDVERKYESYGLKQIIKQEGLEIEGRQFYDASKIKDNYKNPVEFEKIKAYASRDGDDSLALYDLMGAPFFYMAQSIPKPFQLITESASGSQINSLMVRSYMQEKHSIPRATDTYRFEGAISFGKPGVYNNCVRWDVASLYPSIMRQYKIYSPEKDPRQNFLAVTEHFAVERLKNKKLAKDTGDKYYNDLQNAQKIFINSLYGFMGAPGLNFNFVQGAEYVTQKGREILRQAIEWASGMSYDQWSKDNKGEAEEEVSAT